MAHTILIDIGVLIVLFPNARLIPIVWISQIINGMMLPFVLIFMLLLTKKELMDADINSMSFNYIV